MAFWSGLGLQIPACFGIQETTSSVPGLGLQVPSSPGTPRGTSPETAGPGVPWGSDGPARWEVIWEYRSQHARARILPFRPGGAHLEGTLKLIAHPPELAAIALCSPEVGRCRTRAASEGAGLLLLGIVILLGPLGVRAVATPGLHRSSAYREGRQCGNDVNLNSSAPSIISSSGPLMYLCAHQSVPFRGPLPSSVKRGKLLGLFVKIRINFSLIPQILIEPQ